jgi:molybdopterin-binding protein
MPDMPQLRIIEAAALLGVSDDTVRRWIDAGRLPAEPGPGGRLVVDGRALAELARTLADAPAAGRVNRESARNRLHGIDTKVTKDTVMAQVEMQAGPFRVVSLMSREAADDLALEPGVVAVASVKSTHVVVEFPDGR